MSEQKPLSVNGVVAFSIEQFAEVAWQKLGLHPDPITGSIEMNLAEAKTAIDVVGFLWRSWNRNLMMTTSDEYKV